MSKKGSKSSPTKKQRIQQRADRAEIHDLGLLGIQTGNEIEKAPAYCLKIEGERGAGKTTFLLEEVAAAAEKYGPERVMCCIIDMDNGSRRLFGREDIIPPEYLGCFLRKPAQHFEDVYVYMQIFTDILTKHYLDYPTDSARFLVLENEGQFWLSCRDHYAEEVHGMSERELMQARMAQAKQEKKYNATTGKMESKKMLPTYAEGRRAAYTVINRNYLDFFIMALSLTDEINCHFIYTTLAVKQQVFQNDQATDKWNLTVKGKPDKSDGYPDYIVQLWVDEKSNDEDKWMIKCTKNRDGPRFKMDNHGPELFWNFIEKAKSDLIAKKKAKKNKSESRGNKKKKIKKTPTSQSKKPKVSKPKETKPDNDDITF